MADNKRLRRLVLDDDRLSPVFTPIAGPVVAHRVGLTAADAENYPAAYVDNSDGYDTAKISIVGATWGPTDTAIVPTFQCWRRDENGLFVPGRTFTETPFAKFTAVLTNAGALTFLPTSLIDEGQNFASLKPTSPASSQYIITAEPDGTDDVAVFGWLAPGGISKTANVRRGHLDGSDAGWVGGATPDAVTVGDNQILGYSVRIPNILATETFRDLAGADFAITLVSVAGTGQFVIDIDVALS
jgi:hypothetical protein